MDILDEQEQSERVRQWLQNNAASLLGGVLIGIIALMGWEYWQNKNSERMQQADAVYTSLTKAYKENQLDTIKQLYTTLTKDYGNTTYATFANFYQAQQTVTDKKYDDAISFLQKAKQNSSEQALQDLAKIRLAQTQLAHQQPQEALNTLERVTSKSYHSFASELRGDAYTALKKVKEATDAYDAALTADTVTPSATQKTFIEMKRDNLLFAVQQTQLVDPVSEAIKLDDISTSAQDTNPAGT